MKTGKFCLAVALAGLIPTATMAQEFYFGGGLAYTAGASKGPDFGFGNESEVSAGMVTLIVGQRFAAGNGFAGWETSADLSFGTDATGVATGSDCSSGAVSSYLCKHKATLRLVGIYGTPVADGTEVYGSLGVGMLLGDYSSSPLVVESASTYGLTVGLGVNREFGNGLIGRGEVIYDSFTQDTQTDETSDYTGATIRFGLLRRF